MLWTALEIRMLSFFPVYLGTCTGILGHSGQSCTSRANSLKALHLPQACWGCGWVGSWVWGVCVSRASSDVERYKLWLHLGQYSRKLGWAQQERIEMEKFKERVSGAQLGWSGSKHKEDTYRSTSCTHLARDIHKASSKKTVHCGDWLTISMASECDPFAECWLEETGEYSLFPGRNG